MPAAGRRRVFFGAPRHQRLPVHGLHVDLEAGFLHQRFGNRRQVGQDLQIGRMHEHDGRAVVARLLQQLLGLLEVGVEPAVQALLGEEGRAAGEIGVADLVVFGIAHHRFEEILLVEGIKQGLANLGIVERLGGPVRTEGELVAEHIPIEEFDIAIADRQRQEVMRRRLNEVDFARKQRVDGLLVVRDRAPFHAIDVRHLATGEARCRLGARLVFVELDVDRLVAGLPLLTFEDEGTRAGKI